MPRLTPIRGIVSTQRMYELVCMQEAIRTRDLQQAAPHRAQLCYLGSCEHKTVNGGAIEEESGSRMQFVIFFLLWIVFSLGLPLTLHLLFSSTGYPLVSIGTVVGFVGGALLAALITGLLREDRSSQSN